MKQIDFVLRGSNVSCDIPPDLEENFSLTKSMTPILGCVDIPEEEEEEQELYDDVGQMDEIYEMLPGLIRR